jgi:uncharacterized membrane protein
VLDLLLSLHVLAAALWFGSGLAINVVTRRILADPSRIASLAEPMNWWAGRAHPAAGLVLLLTGPGIVAEAGYSFGDPWILIALVGLIALFIYGGAVVGRSGTALVERAQTDAGGGVREDAQRLLTLMTIETVILGLIIVDMVVKPGL